MMGFGWVRYIGWVGLVKIPMGTFVPFLVSRTPEGERVWPTNHHTCHRWLSGVRQAQDHAAAVVAVLDCNLDVASGDVRWWTLVDWLGRHPTDAGRGWGETAQENNRTTHMGWDVMWWTMVLSQACNAVGVVAGPLLHFSSSVMLLAAVWAIGAIFHQWGIFLFDEPSSGSHAPFRCGRAHPSGPFHPDRPMKWKTRPQLHVALHPARLFCLFFCWGCRCGCSPRDRHCTRPRSSSCGRLDNVQYCAVSHRTA